jgi:phage antirepressor YoqD-like protein
MVEYKDFNYEGNKVTFSCSEHCNMINATEMAKPFGRRPVDWLKLDSTKEFLEALSEVKKSHFAPNSEVKDSHITLVYTKRGGDLNNTEQGTWMHEDVALEFARWLSPIFAIWCNDKIKELLIKGHTILSAEDKAKMVYAECCEQSDVLSTFTGLRKALMLVGKTNYTKRQMMEWLRINGYIVNYDGCEYYPTQSAFDAGYFTVEQRRISRTDRPYNNRSRYKVRITPRGMRHLTTEMFYVLDRDKRNAIIDENIVRHA